MGFIHDIRKLLKLLPKERQSLFFSATMPKAIVELSTQILGEYDRVTIKPEQATAERVSQGIYHVGKKDKPKLLAHLLMEREESSALVFSRTKYGADKIARKLNKAGIKAAAIHGNKSQNNRQKTLGAFKSGDLRVLVATDIAARGIDVAELELVINYDLPNVPDTYVHRIGRTGRASASGIALSFCDTEERPYLRDIEKLIRQRVSVIDGHPFPIDETAVAAEVKQAPAVKPRNGGQGQRNRRGNNGGGRNNRRRRNNRRGGKQE